MSEPQYTAASWSNASAAELLAAMGNERRFEVLRYLVQGEATVNQIVEVVGLSQSALSQHLAVLRKAGIVKTRREAQSIHYSLQAGIVTQILALFAAEVDKPNSGRPVPTERRRAVSRVTSDP